MLYQPHPDERSIFAAAGKGIVAQLHAYCSHGGLASPTSIDSPRCETIFGHGATFGGIMEAQEAAAAAAAAAGGSMHGDLHGGSMHGDQGHYDGTPGAGKGKAWGVPPVKAPLLLVNQATPDGGFAPLYISSQMGHAGAVKFLLGAGAHVDQTNDAGATAVMAASHEGNDPVVRLLVAHGCSVARQRSDCGATALHAAAYNGHVGVVRTLLDADADARARRRAARGARLRCRSPRFGRPSASTSSTDTDTSTALVDLRTHAGATALVLAAYAGRVDVARALLKAGADVNGALVTIADNTDGDTEGDSEGKSEGKSLSSSSASASSSASSSSSSSASSSSASSSSSSNSASGGTPLFAACERGHARMAAVLIAAGAKAEAASAGCNGIPCFHVAALQGHLDVVDVLLGTGADESPGAWHVFLVGAAAGRDRCASTSSSSSSSASSSSASSSPPSSSVGGGSGTAGQYVPRRLRSRSRDFPLAATGGGALSQIYDKRILKNIWGFVHAPRHVRLNTKDVFGRTAEQCAEEMGHTRVAQAIARCQRAVLMDVIRRHLLRVSSSHQELEEGGALLSLSP